MVAIAEQRDPLSGRLPISAPRLDLMPYFKYVPSLNYSDPDPEKLIAWREKILVYGYESEENANRLWCMCRDDILFFINTFCWLFEPRTGKVFPFDTYPFQDYHIMELHKSLIGASSGDGKRYDTGAEKSRDLGYTWMVLTVFFHWWLFRGRSAFRCTSKDVALVDTLGNEDTLLWKLEFLVEHLPSFLKPKYTHTLLRFMNHDNSSSVIGYAATEDAGTGGRCLAIMMDEFAKFGHGIQDEHAWKSTQHITRCRIPVSTFKGAVGTFHRVMRIEETSSIKKLIADWKDHPTRSIGMYQSDDRGEVFHFDDYIFPKDYGFVKDGIIRSPYYDEEDKAPGATRAAIAEELDRDPEGSASPFFSTPLVNRIKDGCRPPDIRGYLDHDRDELETVEFIEDPQGPFKLWIPLGGVTPALRPAERYSVSMGADIGAGNGGERTSNSAVIGWNERTGEQVFEFATNTLRPDLFADWCIACGHWFHGGFINWEINGPNGAIFTKTILDRAYNHIYFRVKEMKRSKKKSKSPGWSSNASSKAETLADFRRDLDCGRCRVKSIELACEIPQYVYHGGKVQHLGAQVTGDESAKGEAHGDRVIGGAVGWIAQMERHVTVEHQDKIPLDVKGAPYDGTLNWRIQNCYNPQDIAFKEAETSLCNF